MLSFDAFWGAWNSANQVRNLSDPDIIAKTKLT